MGRKAVPEAVVAAINSATRSVICRLLLAGLLCGAMKANAAVLPEERADAMYHRYEGGGVSIDGPSILLRTNVGNSVSLFANYYIDSISGASIDVEATASPYAEERTEYSLGMDYLRNKTLMSISVTSSSENDFDAKTMHLGITQDFFGDLTTLSMGYSYGQDDVRRTGDAGFAEQATRHNFSVGLTQVVSKNLIVGLNLENISDQGYLNNPYRAVRFLDANAALGYRFETERYPRSRTSNALAMNANYYLPWRASVFFEGRYFTDTWGIRANTARLGYVHTFGDHWLLEVRSRFYRQDQADFYSDLFNRSAEFDFMARDKELASYRNVSVGFSASWLYQFGSDNWLSKASLNLEYDRLKFDYDNFRDVRVTDVLPGQEPLYQFDADVLRLYFSLWF